MPKSKSNIFCEKVRYDIGKIKTFEPIKQIHKYATDYISRRSQITDTVLFKAAEWALYNIELHFSAASMYIPDLRNQRARHPAFSAIPMRRTNGGAFWNTMLSIAKDEIEHWFRLNGRYIYWDISREFNAYVIRHNAPNYPDFISLEFLLPNEDYVNAVARYFINKIVVTKGNAEEKTIQLLIANIYCWRERTLQVIYAEERAKKKEQKAVIQIT